MSEERLELISYEGTPPVVPIAIQKPQDPKLVKRLEKKSEVYDRRLERYSNMPPQAPGFFASYAKSMVLKRVIEEGAVSSKAIIEELSELDSFDRFSAEEALRIVSDYCLTGGENLYGGGLPEEAPVVEPSWARQKDSA